MKRLHAKRVNRNACASRAAGPTGKRRGSPNLPRTLRAKQILKILNASPWESSVATSHRKKERKIENVAKNGKREKTGKRGKWLKLSGQDS